MPPSEEGSSAVAPASTPLRSSDARTIRPSLLPTVWSDLPPLAFAELEELDVFRGVDAEPGFVAEALPSEDPPEPWTPAPPAEAPADEPFVPRPCAVEPLPDGPSSAPDEDPAALPDPVGSAPRRVRDEDRDRPKRRAWALVRPLEDAVPFADAIPSSCLPTETLVWSLPGVRDAVPARSVPGTPTPALAAAKVAMGTTNANATRPSSRRESARGVI